MYVNVLGDPSHDSEIVSTGRDVGTGGVAAGFLALATIAMITEFIVYSGFAPRVRILKFNV